MATSTAKPQADPAGSPPPRAKFQEVRTPRTFEGAVAQVRELLFGGSLKPGDRLPPERDLSAQLGIGRSALREALRTLEAGGLIVLKKGKTGGAFIATGDSTVVVDSMSDMLRLASVSVDQVFEVRAWLQSGLVQAVCERATPEDISRLRENVLETRRLHEAGDEKLRRTVGVEFHNILAQSTRNPVAVMVMRALTHSLGALSSDLGSYPGPSFYKDRLRLVDALEQRDEDAAHDAMERILKATLQLYRQLEQQKGGMAQRTGAAAARQARPASASRSRSS